MNWRYVPLQQSPTVAKKKGRKKGEKGREKEPKEPKTMVSLAAPGVSKAWLDAREAGETGCGQDLQTPVPAPLTPIGSPAST